MTLHQLLVLEMALFLVGNSAPGRPAVLGVVVQAYRAHVNTSAASKGTTVYDGDHFSTEAGGTLRLRGGAAALDLAGESELLVRSTGNGVQEIEAELIKGTLAFSTEHPAALEIIVRQARMRASAQARTIAQVSAIGPKELLIYARRGALQFSYRGESETLAEGKSYKVILDPSEDGPKKKRKAFRLILIGLGVTAFVYGFHEIFESPDRP